MGGSTGSDVAAKLKHNKYNKFNYLINLVFTVVSLVFQRSRFKLEVIEGDFVVYIGGITTTSQWVVGVWLKKFQKVVVSIAWSGWR